MESTEIKVKRNIISRIFTTLSIEPTIIERRGFVVEYIWLKERLSPDETFTIEAKTSYVIPFIIIVLAALCLVGFKKLTTKRLEINKSVTHMRTKNNEFALKIKLSLKAKEALKNTTLIDKVPGIVKIYKKFGTIKPTRIDAESRRIHWNLGDLDAGEERILTYIVYSKVGVVGKFSLPKALVVYERDGKLHEVASKKVFFMSGQIKK